ncbi:amidohydrolase [Vibrio ulleungensis]|uniref:Amidohydrolase n=1 Tax=Vibrio ulleungensis TaxID=2807619 RepID=A0ABS2HG30_9VIBR|nr:amidohydrolase [Vibrio ulleungensis]MBM7036004.1 amidohydrolase [Vibrio ulleungensis]
MRKLFNRNSVNSKPFIKKSLSTICASAFLSIGAQSAFANAPNEPDWVQALNSTKESSPITVYTAKNIHTMYPGQPEAEAIAVLDGKILSVGSLESMQPWLTRYEHSIDDRFADKVIMPGFIEPHTHMYMSAGFMSSLYIGSMDWPGRNGTNPGSPTHDDVIATLQKAIDEGGDTTEPLIAWGFDPAIHGGALDRTALDAISTTRPIFVIGFAPHFAFLNSQAIAMTGVKDDSTVEGVFKDKDGKLNGVFNEVPAVPMALRPIFGQMTASGGINGDGLRFMADIAKKAGITTTAELMYGAIDFDDEWAQSVVATNDPNFPVRLMLVADVHSLEQKYGDKAIETYKEMQTRNTDNLWVNGVKVLTDGSLPLMSSRVGFPGYLDGTNGSFNSIPWDVMTENLMPYWDNNIPIHIHANGDNALDQALDTLENLQNAQPKFDHRYSIEHFSMSNQMQARRIKALGAVVSANVYFTHFRSLLHTDQAYGPDRASGLARLGDLEREGVVFGIHSDYPQVAVPMLPLTGAWTAANRIAEDNKTVQQPEQRVSVERALRAITIDAAYVLGAENKIGSLEPGKLADFAILEEDPFTVDPVDIKDIEVWGTVLSGKVLKARP